MSEDLPIALGTLGNDQAGSGSDGGPQRRGRVGYDGGGRLAATDITGFGFIGHLHEMTRGSQVRARVHMAAIPVLDEAWDLVRKGVAPGGSHSNRAYFGEAVEWAAGIDDAEQLVLCDAQTSGGMLIAVPAEKAPRLEEALHRAGVPTVACVGEILGVDDRGTIEVSR